MESYYSVVDYIKKRDSVRNKDGIAIEFDGNNITRDEYWKIVESYKNYFISQGFFYGCQKPVTICNKNVPEYEFIYMALLSLGAIPSTVSLSFLKSDIEMHTIDKGADTLIVSTEYIPELKKSFETLNSKKNSIKRIIFTSAGDYRSEENAINYNKSVDFKKMISSLNLPNGVEIIYPSQIKNSRNILINNSNVKDINFLNLNATYSNTGGTTTGVPKCAIHTHEAIIELLKAHEPDIYPEFPLKEGDKALLLIPISHITSQFYALLLRRASGANIVYNPGAFDPNELTKILITDEINDVIAPFGLYVAIAHSDLKPGDLKNLKPSCGGEPTPMGPTKLVNERLKMAGSDSIVIGGGSTEFGSAFMTTYGVEDRCNETGVLIPGAEIKIVNPLNNAEVQPGERGLIYARCKWQMKEYLNNKKATNEFYNYVDEDGKVWGTNNDIGTQTGIHNGKPLYTMDGRVTSFVKQDKKSHRYYPGISFTNGKIDSVDITNGKFLFDMRDTILNIPGVIEAEALLIPYDDNDKTGVPVVNIIISKQSNPADVIRKIYSSYSDTKFLPEGLVFRTHFARSLATDKRETITLKEERNNYYKLDNNGNIIEVILPKGKEPIYRVIENIEDIKIVEPPIPRKIYVKR